MYVCEWDMCWRNFCNFSQVTKKCERHFEFWFPNKKTIMFFWSKLSKLHKKDPILHVTTKFPLKQGETRTSSGPIPHPLITCCTTLWYSQWCFQLLHTHYGALLTLVHHCQVRILYQNLMQENVLQSPFTDVKALI